MKAVSAQNAYWTPAVNSQPGDRRRMAGAGYNGGDLDLEFVLEELDSLTEEQRSAIEALRDLGL